MFERVGSSEAVLSAVIVVFLQAGTLQPSHAQGKPEAMSVQEAEQFALAAVAPKLKHLPAFQFDTPQKNPEGLYVFNAIWQGLPEGSVEIGFYAVDPVTGTVWDGVAECQQIAMPALRALQQKRQKRLGINSDQIRKFQAKGPQCS